MLQRPLLDLCINVMVKIARETQSNLGIGSLNPASFLPDRVEKFKQKGYPFWTLFWLLNISRNMSEEESKVFRVFKNDMKDWRTFTNEVVELTTNNDAWGLALYVFAKFLKDELSVPEDLEQDLCSCCRTKVFVAQILNLGKSSYVS
ncbi:hypothetical protein TWF788_006163 [Orbilia oligospora]|uniref:Uncharacterized protein n=1 Tax=Orbilia oligospora TaxID=2813651 RepID=A0A7C8Q3P6_ORBOL|nr:hypothetical protein TWF788_006163 [Orbilia oligospora]